MNQVMQVNFSIDIPNLGARIREARLKSPKSPTMVAALAGMSLPNLYRIEAEDTKSIPIDTLQRLSLALGLSFDAEVKDALKQYADAFITRQDQHQG